MVPTRRFRERPTSPLHLVQAGHRKSPAEAGLSFSFVIQQRRACVRGLRNGGRPADNITRINAAVISICRRMRAFVPLCPAAALSQFAVGPNAEGNFTLTFAVAASGGPLALAPRDATVRLVVSKLLPPLLRREAAQAKETVTVSSPLPPHASPPAQPDS